MVTKKSNKKKHKARSKLEGNLYYLAIGLHCDSLENLQNLLKKKYFYTFVVPAKRIKKDDNEGRLFSFFFLHTI